jgi:hypothetical protein
MKYQLDGVSPSSGRYIRRCVYLYVNVEQYAAYFMQTYVAVLDLVFREVLN